MGDGWVLGLGGSSHEFSAALVRDGDIKVAVEQERITRTKHGYTWWHQDPVAPCIDYCLNAVGITRADLDRVVSSDLLPTRALATLPGIPVELYGHHLCHAASGVMMLPSGQDAVVLAYDGMGSIVQVRPGVPPTSLRETFTFYGYRGGRLEMLGATRGTGFLEYDTSNAVTASFGLLYEMVTALIGFHPHDAGKTMGLAAWGRPRYREEFNDFATIGKSMEDVFRFDPRDGAFSGRATQWLTAGNSDFQTRADIAASLQQIANELLEACWLLLSPQGLRTFVVTGGCGLNTVANGQLCATFGDDIDLFVPPHVHDSGMAFGAMWVDRSLRTPEVSTPFTFNARPLTPWLARPGRVYGREDIVHAVGGGYPHLYEDGRVSSPEEVARFLSGNRAIGIFNGRSEIGPRALGGRSIIADPRQAAMRERINRRVKFREPFRPLAPIVLDADFDEYFTPPSGRDFFMLRTAEATQRCRREAPAVVHVDGTARVQVIDPDMDPFLARVLAEFKRLTGVAILLNTSMNHPGVPIVETPAEAVELAVSQELDGLWLQDRFLRAFPADDTAPSGRRPARR